MGSRPVFVFKPRKENTMNQLIAVGPETEVKQMDNDNLIMVALQMPKQMAIKARVVASQKNQSRSELMREALKEYLSKQESEGKTNGVG
ncbi:MAG: hypothetical protein DPW09_00520 [Anaerolineae bacterium]|nr:hypothetical protein [Anaerolineae bacterium]